jgi:hypothetical protein
MAGDEYTLYLCDNNKEKLEEKYLGKLRYKSINKFSFQKYKYYGSNEKYEIEERKSDGDYCYNVFTLETIQEIKKIVLNHPISDSEREAYEDIKDIIDWIDFVLKKYEKTYTYSEYLCKDSIHLLLCTDID